MKFSNRNIGGDRKTTIQNGSDLPSSFYKFKLISYAAVAAILVIILCTFIFKDKIINIFSFFTTKNNTFSYVVGSFEDIERLYVLENNVADVYEYTDSDKKRTYILRFSVNVYYDLSDVKTEKREDGSYLITIPEPTFEGALINDDTIYTEEKKIEESENKDEESNDEYGIEIFSESTSLFGSKFQQGDDRKFAESKINEYKESNKEKIKEDAEENFKEKLKDLQLLYNDSTKVEVAYE